MDIQPTEHLPQEMFACSEWPDQLKPRVSPKRPSRAVGSCPDKAASLSAVLGLCKPQRMLSGGQKAAGEGSCPGEPAGSQAQPLILGMGSGGLSFPMALRCLRGAMSHLLLRAHVSLHSTVANVGGGRWAASGPFLALFLQTTHLLPLLTFLAE